ncbi:MAG: sigma-54-dependent transcriptional regulator [Myxococcota bacterium]
MAETLRVLIVDDNVSAARSMASLLQIEGFDARWVGSGGDGIQELRRENVDVAVVDLKMEPIDGMQVLRVARSLPNPVEVVMVTAHGSVHAAVEAVRLGAHDFLLKPVDFDALKARLAELAGFVRLKRAQAEKDENTDPGRPASVEIVGASPAMVDLRNQVRSLAQVGSTVLIRGETGTGKELVARALHEWGLRREHPFVAVNCAAIPRDLLESELFGHRRGSFSGAIDHRVGRFEAAEAGTLFLDEVGDLPADLQVKLLRVIETRAFTPVGANQEKRFGCRLVAATHRDLETEVAAGRFRQDLFFRLNVIPVRIPPLRERPQDVPLLIAAIADRYARDLGRPVPAFTRDAVAAACRYGWPGNVRELANLVERAVVLGRVTLLPDDASVPAWPLGGEPPEITASAKFNLSDYLYTEEGKILRRVWDQTGGNQSEMARLLGVERTALRYRLKKHGLLT